MALDKEAAKKVLAEIDRDELAQLRDAKQDSGS